MLVKLEGFNDLGEDDQDIFSNILLGSDFLDFQSNVSDLIKTIETVGGISGFVRINLINQRDIETTSMD